MSKEFKDSVGQAMDDATAGGAEIAGSETCDARTRGKERLAVCHDPRGRAPHAWKYLKRRGVWTSSQRNVWNVSVVS